LHCRVTGDPTWLDRQVETWRLHPADVGALVEAQQERFTEAWSRLGSLPARREAGLRRLLAESVKWARLREQARSEYVRDRWAVRRFALRAGALTGAGDDVFYLTVPELIGLLEGDRSPLGLVDGRRRTYHDYAALPSYPPLILGRFDPASWASDPNRRADFFNGSSPSDSLVPAPSSTGGAITGIPASAGTVEGVARVLRRPDEGCELREGEVLVAVQTDVAWTLLFARAAAVVTDVGAPLSHAAIVARELGIPAVVGCGDATARLRTGDRVRVDGTRGVVTPL
jgi:pyruvate,water dikinase